jgi:hypothetical protein
MSGGTAGRAFLARGGLRLRFSFLARTMRLAVATMAANIGGAAMAGRALLEAAVLLAAALLLAASASAAGEVGELGASFAAASP